MFTNITNRLSAVNRNETTFPDYFVQRVSPCPVTATLRVKFLSPILEVDFGAPLVKFMLTLLINIRHLEVASAVNS
jgi:hypothetical protein